jgi:hypothetical protein
MNEAQSLAFAKHKSRDEPTIRGRLPAGRTRMRVGGVEPLVRCVGIDLRISPGRRASSFVIRIVL